MPTMIFSNAYLRLTTTSQDLSALCKRVSLRTEFEEQDDTRMGMTSRSRVPGLNSWSVEAEFVQEFQSTEPIPLDKLFGPMVGNSAAVELAMRPVNAGRSSDNPEYRGNVRLFQYNPIDGAVGDVADVTVRFLSAGNLTRSASTS